MRIPLEDLCVMISNVLGGMAVPNRPMHDPFNREFERERQYDTNDLSQSVQSGATFKSAAKTAYDTIMKAVYDGNGGICFIDEPGGTFKTFLILIILNTIRAQSQIALTVAFSRIAATLLEGGHTAHSALKLPFNLQTIDEPTN